MWDTLIAVVGTLGGGLIGGLVQLRGARAERRETRQDGRRTEALSAVTTLVAAFTDHRRAMWQHEDAKLTNQSAQVIAELLGTHHDTRSAINVPMATVAILAPPLAAPAREAAAATYAMRDANTLDVLEARRAVALAATDQFVAAAAEFFAATGVVVTA